MPVVAYLSVGDYIDRFLPSKYFWLKNRFTNYCWSCGFCPDLHFIAAELISKILKNQSVRQDNVKGLIIRATELFTMSHHYAEPCVPSPRQGNDFSIFLDIVIKLLKYTRNRNGWCSKLDQKICQLIMGVFKIKSPPVKRRNYLVLFPHRGPRPISEPISEI